MKLLTIYRKNVYITYKQNVCSFPSFAIIIFAIFTIVTPFLIVYTINHTIWTRDLIVYEKPNVNFQYQYLVLAHFENTLLRCSSFRGLNELTDNLVECDTISFGEDDFDYDGKLDQMQFRMEFEGQSNSSLRELSVFLVLESKLKVLKFCVMGLLVEK